MPGEIQGRYLKSVLLGLLGTDLLFPELSQRLEKMGDDDWYEWDEYKRLVNEVAAKLSPATMTSVGWRVMMQASAIYKKQFATPDAIFRDFLVLVRAVVRNAQLDEFPHTVSFEPGHVVIEAGTAQPMALVEGYLRGIVQIFGNVVTALDSREVQRASGPGYRFDMRWI